MSQFYRYVTYIFLSDFNSIQVKSTKPSTHLQVMIMAAQVGSHVVLSEHWHKAIHQTLSWSVLGHRPHRVVTSNQEVVSSDRIEQCVIIISKRYIANGISLSK